MGSYQIPHKILNSIEYKLCTKCNRWVFIKLYSLDRSKPDGLYPVCKKCHRIQCSSKREYKRQRRLANLDEFKKRERITKRKQYTLDPEKFKERRKAWYRANREKVTEWRVKPKNRLSSNMSRAIRSSLKKGKDGYHWECLVNYTRKDLVSRLESLFVPGMNWDNYGKWEIDHIKPISSFTYETYEDPEFKECWALTNLQPLWMSENRSKWGKAA